LKNYTDYEIGKVVDLEGNDALLEIEESEACAGCHAKVVCSAGKEGNRCMRLKNTLGAKIGDQVAFDTSESQQLAINTMQFGLPLAGFLIGLFGYFYLLAEKFALPKEIGAFATGLLLMLLAGVITKRWSNKKVKTMVLHQMKEIIPENE